MAYYYHSPIGILELEANENGLVAVRFIKEYYTESDITPQYRDVVKQLDEYFNKQRIHFDLKLAPEGTEFQKSVWKALTDIPYGKTKTYKEIAQIIGKAKAVRAVGGANNKNPLAIIIPCHRVIGTNGELTGYAAGLDKKQWLLNFENHTS